MSGAADAPDRGLHCCFQVANVKPGWAQEFVTRHRLRTLDDFVVAAASEPGEQGVEALVNQVPPLRGISWRWRALGLPLTLLRTP